MINLRAVIRSSKGNYLELNRSLLRKSESSNKTFKKAIMKPSSKYYTRTKNLSDLYAYRKQRNLVVQINKQAKTKYFDQAV